MLARLFFTALFAIFIATGQVSAAVAPKDTEFGCNTETWRTDNGQPCFLFKKKFWIVSGVYEADKLVDSGPQHSRVSRVMMYRNAEIVCPARRVFLEPRDPRESLPRSAMIKAQRDRHDLRWHPVCASRGWEARVQVARINRANPGKSSLVPKNAPRVDFVNADTKDNNLGLIDTYKVEWNPPTPAPSVAMVPPPAPPPQAVAPASPKMVCVKVKLSTSAWGACTSQSWWASSKGRADKTPVFRSQESDEVCRPAGSPPMWYYSKATGENFFFRFDKPS